MARESFRAKVWKCDNEDVHSPRIFFLYLLSKAAKTLKISLFGGFIARIFLLFNNDVEK